ncbi:hypothetical protein GCM10007385_02060 [Tateyamaria omphalii]|uniref:hypothetical protein n=1 Tax=Tateyamaria omphalii TaxID=299262 RepID=UPI0016753E16|nr:hypothetical protein [Tateyamaria omphalii]GGX38783.1 hypothetical protein GCM10007385_02060 [Tateyamaria omphalii]
MIRTLVAATALTTALAIVPAVAQDAPPPGPAANTETAPTEGQLFGGELTPAATAAVVGVGIAIIALSSDGSDGTTTSSTTTSSTTSTTR